MATVPHGLAYRPELDGMRGLAVLAVMLYHFRVPFAQHGFLGVDVFFVLSGFLISSIVAREWQRAGTVDFRRFYQRRAFRLLPAFWVMLILIAPLIPTAQGLAAFTYTINWTMGLHLLPIFGALGHTWSLAVEWQYYLVWPAVLVLLLGRLRPRTVALAALAIGLASATWRAVLWQFDPDWYRAFTGADTHIDGLLIGSAIGLLATLTPPMLTRRLDRGLWIATAFVLAAVELLILAPSLPFAFFATAGDLLAAVATAVIILRVAVYPPGFVGRALRFRPLVWMGVISYGLYLWHVPVWTFLGGQGLADALIATAITFAVATVSYRVVETPFLRAKGGRRPEAPQPSLGPEPAKA